MRPLGGVSMVSLWIALSLANAAGEVDRENVAVSWSWPLHGRLTSEFGMRDGRLHAGVDIATARGRTVRSAGEGIVSFAGRNQDYGLMVEIRHPDGHTTRYAHLDEIWVRRGASVDAGRALGPVGVTGRVTGPHLHFELRKGSRPVDPLPLAIEFAEPSGAEARPRRFYTVKARHQPRLTTRLAATFRQAAWRVLRWLV